MGNLAAIAVALCLCACSMENEDAQLPALDLDEFRCNVEPVLMARCGFYECHGTVQRPFRVYAPNRLRLNMSVPRLAEPLSDDEHAANFEAARALADAANLDQSQLLSKPLDVDSGGLYHRGKSLYAGRDVFSSPDDLGYQRIAAWLAGAESNGGCDPSEEASAGCADRAKPAITEIAQYVRVLWIKSGFVRC